jgi:dipeptidyl aminopeptidase/acylaminoacyl peptidase
MPLVRGESLRDRLTRERQLPVADAVRIAREVASALDHAHRHGVVHRDVKPENVLLGEDGQTLLADFGGARGADPVAVAGTLTGTGFSVGTPAYMSPEQAAGERDVDGRSDQYALGCVLYECLAGEPPFTGRTPQAVLAKRFAGPAPDVGVLRDGVPAGVRAALGRALARSPADRFPTAAAFAAALAGAAPGDAPQPPPGVHALAPARSRRRAAIAAGLGVAALALVATVALRRASETGTVPRAAGRGAPADRSPARTQQLTFSGEAYDLAFSPDGRQVAYIARQCDSTATGTGAAAGGDCTAALRVLDVGTGQSSVLATGKDVAFPRWSPDGAWVLTIMEPEGGQRGMYLTPRLGGASRRIGAPALAAFTATGDTVLLAALAAPGAPRFVRRALAATGETIDSAPLPPALADLESLRPSPDGRWVALRVGDRLWLATPDRRVTDSIAFFNSHGQLRWDPRGDALYETVPGTGVNSWLIRVRVDAGRGRFAAGIDTVLNLGPSSPNFDIAPDGRSLVHAGGGVANTLWALDLDARPLAPRRLAASTAYLGDPYISSDGQLVAYDATDHTGNNVYVMPFAGGPGQPVTHEAAGWYTQGWVPGGHRLTYAGTAPGAPVHAQEVPDGPRRVVGPAGTLLLADGATVALDVLRRRLVVRVADGAERVVQLPDSLGGFLTFAGADEDGGGAYVLGAPAAPGATARSRFVRVDRASGALTPVALDLPADQGAASLSTRAGTLVYATWPPRRIRGRPTVWRLRPGRRPVKVAALPLECGAGSLTMSADGRRFACRESTVKPDLYLLEGFDRYRQ